MSPELKQQILDELDRLDSEQQKRVLDYAHELAVRHPRGVPGKKLLMFSAAFDPSDLDAMRRAIEDGCERVDLNGW